MGLVYAYRHRHDVFGQNIVPGAYYFPHHRKETLVTISWLDLETPDELLIHVLNHFGKVKSNVMWSKMKQEESDGDLEKLLNNILSGRDSYG